MRIQRRTVKLAGVGAAVLLAAAATTGAASATAGSAAHTTVYKAASVSTTAGDTDNVQQGDQTTPDVPGATDAAGTSAKKLATTAAPTATEKPGTETPGTAEAPSSETGPSDGPGGHADPAGSTVDHQFQGNE
jgi:hypothetical protein